MPIDEEPSGPVKEPIEGRRLDKRQFPCSNVEEALAPDHDAKIKRREIENLEQMFDPAFDEDEDPTDHAFNL